MLYKHVLDHQVGERKNLAQEHHQREKHEEEIAMKYNPYGKPGGGAPRFDDGNQRHWSKLEPATSHHIFDAKKKRVQSVVPGM